MVRIYSNIIINLGAQVNDWIKMKIYSIWMFIIVVRMLLIFIIYVVKHRSISPNGIIKNNNGPFYIPCILWIFGKIYVIKWRSREVLIKCLVNNTNISLLNLPFCFSREFLSLDDVAFYASGFEFWCCNLTTDSWTSRTCVYR